MHNPDFLKHKSRRRTISEEELFGKKGQAEMKRGTKESNREGEYDQSILYMYENVRIKPSVLYN
jgi:hypothetical protein